MFAGAWHEPVIRKEIESFLEKNKHLRITWLGSVSGEKKRQAFEDADIFVFPTYYPPEGHPWVLIEAMAAGKPVICLDTGGPGMHVTDDWGFKISPSSPKHAVQELASCLERMYLDRDLRDRLGRAAHERAENYYHWDKLGEQLMEIYKNALAAGRDS